jgi:hypothetical protein
VLELPPGSGEIYPEVVDWGWCEERGVPSWLLTTKGG